MTDAPLTPNYAARLPVRRKATGRLVWLAVAVLLLAVGFVWAWRAGWVRLPGGSSIGGAQFQRIQPSDLAITLSEDGEIKPVEQIEIKCEVEGQATILQLAAESTRVKAGDVLVVLASDSIVEKIEQEEIEFKKLTTDHETAQQNLAIQRNQNASDVNKAKIDLMLAERELAKYLEGDFNKSLQTIEIQKAETQLRLAQKEEDLQKNQNLMTRGFVTAATIQELELELKTFQLQLQQSELEERILMEYEKPMMVAQKESTITQAREALERVKAAALSREAQVVAEVAQFASLLDMRRKRLDRLRLQLDRCKIVAPREGVVQYPNEESRRWSQPLSVGSNVTEGQTILVLPDTSRMVVAMRIHESDRHRVEKDMPCEVRVTAVPGRLFTGKINKIAQFADSANSWLNPELKEHATEVLLDATDAPLSPGDSAEVKIHIDYLKDVIAAPVQAIHTRGTQAFVLVRRGAGVVPAKVTLGPSNVSSVQILSGLAEGDEVLLNADEQQLAKLPNPRPAGERGMEGAARTKPQEDAAAGDAVAAAGQTDGQSTAAAAEPAAQDAAQK